MGSTQPRNKRRSSSVTPSFNKRFSRSGGIYSRGFEQHLIDHGIYSEGYESPDDQISEKPKNWETINQRLSQSRAFLSSSKFDDEEFQKFKRVNTYASNELSTITLIPTIEGGINDSKTVERGYSFENVKPLTDGTISSAWPDRFYGARPEQLDRELRDELSDIIIPSTQDSRSMLPNFFLKVKGSEESAAVTKRQACYDGALGARVMQILQSYEKDDSVYDNNTYIIASTYHDGQLKLYISHSIESMSTRHEPEYVMTQLKGWSTISDSKTFRQGVTWYRNARHWTGEKRNEFIMIANVTLSKEESQQIFTSQNMTTSVSTVLSIDSDSSADSDVTSLKTRNGALQIRLEIMEERSPENRTEVWVDRGIALAILLMETKIAARVGAEFLKAYQFRHHKRHWPHDLRANIPFFVLTDPSSLFQLRS